ncbi:helix-turn-helix transcriptional regulator [Vibrio gallicus]|uniref:helix-turn-helix transcriptional regulator n=1 Tax=Vibrio gallicus TaxID=190897 RepID=UPI0021C4084C|nr:WYL domain-containing protein [Vibrio gallicus]
MSKSFERFQVVLQNIPCAPEHITSTELRQILLNKELLDSNLDERSQLKTVQRVINKVVADYQCVDLDTSKRPHQISIALGHQHPINPAAMSSVLSLQIIEHEVLKMLPPNMRKEVSNLLSTGNSEQDKRVSLWKERFCYAPIEFQLTPPAFEEVFIEQIERAILEKRSLKMKYKKRGSNSAQPYHIDPLGLTLHGNSFYLIATKFDTGEYRTFAIHRISELKSSFSSISPRRTFNTKQHIEANIPHFSGGDWIEIQLKIDNYHGLHLIEETKLSNQQQIVEKTDTYTVIKAQVRQSLGLEWWLMKNANIVQVVEPQHIKLKIVNNLQSALKLYTQS